MKAGKSPRCSVEWMDWLHPSPLMEPAIATTSLPWVLNRLLDLGRPEYVRVPTEVGDAGDLGNLVAAMADNEYGPNLLQKLCHGNWLDVLGLSWSSP